MSDNEDSYENQHLTAFDDHNHLTGDLAHAAMGFGGFAINFGDDHNGGPLGSDLCVKCGSS
jgi:hypothetical protein